MKTDMTSRSKNKVRITGALQQILNSDSKRKVRQIVEQQFNNKFQNTLHKKVKKTAEIEVDISKVKKLRIQLGKESERESTAGEKSMRKAKCKTTEKISREGKNILINAMDI